MERLGQSIILGWMGLCFTAWGNVDRGLVGTSTAKNLALIAGSSHGLPGIDKDLNTVSAILANPAFEFTTTKLWQSTATASQVGGYLKTLASNVDEHGTFYFYFSGHGNVGNIWVQDRLMSISEIRKAIETGRLATGPLDRLVFMVDSCNSGSLVDPLRRNLMPLVHEEMANEMADSIVEEFGQRDYANYWDKLFVFVSSQANETSLAGSSGSVFTVALKRAFDELLPKNGTLGEWVDKTKAYTKGHHPVSRLVPTDLNNEKISP